MEWLDNLRSGVRAADEKATNALRYYMGPAYAPVNALAQFAGMLSPGADMMDMVDQGNALMRSDGPRSAGMNALGLGAATLGMAIPGTAKGVTEAVDGTRKGIRAYHGSPHDFDAFDLNKIGTGEGAQAYGHGLYFAENEGVARSYRDKLRYPRMDGTAASRQAEIADDLNYYNGNEDAVRASYEGMISQGSPEAQALGREKLAMLDEVISANPGRMYEVNINADPADFLDWDAPLSAQSEKVRGAASHYLNDIEDASAYDLLSVYGRGSSDVERELAEAGIPGIKYLDAGSRGAGDGSRNYVVFDPATIEILRKYGLLGMIGGGGAMAYGAGGDQDGL